MRLRELLQRGPVLAELRLRYPEFTRLCPREFEGVCFFSPDREHSCLVSSCINGAQNHGTALLRKEAFRLERIDVISERGGHGLNDRIGLGDESLKLPLSNLVCHERRNGREGRANALRRRYNATAGAEGHNGRGGTSGNLIEA